MFLYKQAFFPLVHLYILEVDTIALTLKKKKKKFQVILYLAKVAVIYIENEFLKEKMLIRL